MREWPEGEWVSASEALILVVQSGREKTAAKSLIADCLKDRLICAHADMIWESDIPSVGKSLARSPSINSDDAMVISDHLWRSSINWQDDLDNWRWRENTFCITRSLLPFKRFFFHGVLLSKDDVRDNILERSVKDKNNGGRPKQQDKRDAFWLAVVQLAIDQRLTINGFQSQAELLKEIQDLASSREGQIYGERTLAPLVSQVWKRFVEG